MKNSHIVGNWKMSLNKEDSIALANNIKSISKKEYLNIEVAPTSLYIDSIVKILKESDVNVISQNFDYKTLGSYTGGVCLDQLKEMGVTKTILGHSERRSKFNESDEQVNNKLETVLNSDLFLQYTPEYNSDVITESNVLDCTLNKRIEKVEYRYVVYKK